MTLSALVKFVLPPVFASATVFSLMTLPLAIVGDQEINVRFQEEPFFSGKLRDVATPYVILSTALSLGAGVCATAICGWRNSSRKSSQVQEHLSSLEKELQEKEQLLKELMLSESRLQISGLNHFLEVETSLPAHSQQQTVSHRLTQPIVMQTPVAISQPIHEQSSNHTVNAASAFSSAQTFRGYAQTNIQSTENSTAVNRKKPVSVTTLEFEELQQQLREMMRQMQAMQENMQLMPQMEQTKASESFQVHYEVPKTNEVRFT
ncbi:hypothetical protein [Calothrix sp. 336/3]|uniref:hypothetical protein n=1 Tax=Calothrix sp. 336/3 TaxID=1337936 RepID=UPI0004E2FAD1|nr:hypothetical protein [Calothrix sp. 336/3]AKG22357.1 hypothetical protein IJ00_14755 [Calothrix sp. 336/3]